MAECLKKYVDRVADVPSQLHRLFMLIRDLDARAATLQEEVDSKCRQQLELAASGRGAPAAKRQKTGAHDAAAPGDSALQAEIEAGMQKLLSLSEEKVGIMRMRGVAGGRAPPLCQQGRMARDAPRPAAPHLCNPPLCMARRSRLHARCMTTWTATSGSWMMTSRSLMRTSARTRRRRVSDDAAGGWGLCR